MAKAKKQSESQKSNPSKKATKSAAGAEPAVPQIDTSMAAQSAASMISNRDPRASESEGGEKRESSSFKQLKASLNKPALQGPASFLHSTAPQKKSNLPFSGRKQVGHNQTFGADVNRSGVPRRTGG